jgi:hypothetical protein
VLTLLTSSSSSSSSSSSQVLAEEFIVRSVKPLTFPKEFRFATEARSRRCPCWSVFVLYSRYCHHHRHHHQLLVQT